MAKSLSNPNDVRFTPSIDQIWAHVTDHLFSGEQSLQPAEVGVVVLIDGASGTGKTTLAAELAARWPENRAVSVIHMDDLYGGWTGLAAGILALEEGFFASRQKGDDAHLRTYNWGSGQWEDGPTIPAHVDVIVEGCGAFGAAQAPTTDVRIWLDAPLDLRRARALSRGGEDFQQHWDEWEQQFQQYENRAHPSSFGSLHVRANR